MCIFIGWQLSEKCETPLFMQSIISHAILLLEIPNCV